jgi:predicted dehydrogenase
MTPIRTCLVGVGGYGNGYVDAALDRPESLGIELVGAVDPAPAGCRRLDEILARVGPIYDCLDRFYEKQEADLVVISAPIHLHAPYTLTALRHGSHVLCEKPVASVVQDGLAMATAAREADRLVAIGFQWSYSGTIHAIRRDIASGKFGEPLSLRTVVSWPRPDSYYQRNSWAGSIQTESGEWVLDSPVNNATAHYLHNALFVLGDAGTPVAVEAELYRAREIESYDTAAMRVLVECGAEVLFYTSHSVPSTIDPVIYYRFSDAEVYSQAPGTFIARYPDGSTSEYGNPETSPHEKLSRVLKDIRAGDRPACSIEDSLPHSIVACGAHESTSITPFPAEVVHRRVYDPADSLVWVDGLQAVFTQCFAQGILPAEHGGVSWARAGSRVDLRAYREYPARRQ